jgi:hypothetical protein
MQELVMVADYDLAKEFNNKDEFSDRPQWEFMLFYMRFNNSGESHNGYSNYQ